MKHFLIYTNSDGEAPDLRIDSVFEFDVDIESRGYSRIIQGKKMGPPIRDEIFYDTEDGHKVMSYGIIKYIAWRNNVFVDEIYTNIKESTITWEFNGISSNQKPDPQYKIVRHWAQRRISTRDLSGTDVRHFYDLYNSGSNVPLYQELLTEVESQLSGSKRRSTYLLLYTALEVATKTLIKSLKPDTKYLISNVQSPDLKSLYRDYINIEIINLASSEDIDVIFGI